MNIDLSKFINRINDAENELKKLGVSIRDTNNNFKSIAEVLSELSEKYQNEEDEDV